MCMSRALTTFSTVARASSADSSLLHITPAFPEKLSAIADFGPLFSVPTSGGTPQILTVSGGFYRMYNACFGGALHPLPSAGQTQDQNRRQ